MHRLHLPPLSFKSPVLLKSTCLPQSYHLRQFHYFPHSKHDLLTRCSGRLNDRGAGAEPPKHHLSTSSTLQALPDILPDAPPYPCPAVESGEWLGALYQRGWKIVSSVNNPHGTGTMALEKLFRFGAHKSTMKFFDGIMGIGGGICEGEGHHPLGIRVTYSTILFTLKTTNATVPAARCEALRRPAITLRDIRLAILIQQSFERQCPNNDRQVIHDQGSETIISDLQHALVEDLLR